MCLSWILPFSPNSLLPVKVKGEPGISDWWRLGVLMVELLLGYSPFQDDHHLEDYFNGKTPPPADFTRICMKIKLKVSSDVYTAITYLFEGNPDYQSVQKLDIFKGIDWDDLGMQLVKPPFCPFLKPKKATEYNSFSHMIGEIGPKSHLPSNTNNFVPNW